MNEEFFNALLKAHPAFPTSHSPAYSNIAFQILAYAFEAITGNNNFGSAMHDRIFAPLGMNGSSFTVPNSTAHGVIPGGDATTTSWNRDLGVDAA